MILIALAIPACAPGAHSPTSPSTTSDLGADPLAAREEVSRLDAEVQADLLRIGVDVDDGTDPTAGTPGGSPDPLAEPPTWSALRAVCTREPVTETCGDVCALADRVCTAGERICALAGDLAGDDWAQERCEAARRGCALAEQRCCDCW